MKELPKEKFRVLAEVYGWSHDHARGFVDGEISRLRGKKPSKHVLIGIDEYSLGFRAGYFERRQVLSARTAGIPITDLMMPNTGSGVCFLRP